MTAARRRHPIALVALGATALSVACASDGRDLADPEPGATAPPLASEATTTSTTAPAGPVLGGTDGPLSTAVLSSDLLVEGATVPPELGCGGTGGPPPFSWEGIGAAAVELALVVSDADARVHWAVTGIAPALGELDGADLPAGAVEHLNSTGEQGWLPLCPPPGGSAPYTATLFELSAPSGFERATPGSEVLDAVAASASATLTVTGAG